MYDFIHNYSLKSNNTFGINARTKHYLTIEEPEDLIRFFNDHKDAINYKKLFLGAGSNLLFVGDFDGLIIHPEIMGIRLISENKDFAVIEAGSGVVWDYFVEWCVEKGLNGIENLSLIPGNIGAVPVQNIGAYGVEAESVISEVRGIDPDTLEYKSFQQAECKFGYRTSVFKAELKEHFLVTSVIFRLLKQPNFQLHYGTLEKEVDKIGTRNLHNIRRAVIAIRESKLPDPVKVGNAGSFFKNPVVPEIVADELKNQYPDIPLYPMEAGFFKIAAGWLIEKAGWKGRSVGRSAIHDKQALVIINKGDATGREIFELSEMVSKDILRKFNLELEREVQVVGD